MEMFLASFTMVYIFRSLFVLREYIFQRQKPILDCLVIKKGYQYHKIRKVFSTFYHIHSELIVKYNTGLNIILQGGILW